MNPHRIKAALIVVATSLMALPAEASLITLSFDIQVLSNSNSISINGQEIQVNDSLQYSVTLDTDAPGFRLGNSPGIAFYFGDVVAGGGVAYEGVEFASHIDSAGLVTLYNALGRRDTDVWSLSSDFSTALGPTLTADTGSGPTDLLNFSEGQIQTELVSAFGRTGVNLVDTTDLAGALDDINSLLASQLDLLNDGDRSFDISWSGAGGTASLSGIVGGVEVTVVPEPETYAIMVAVLVGLGIWIRPRRPWQADTAAGSSVC